MVHFLYNDEKKKKEIRVINPGQQKVKGVAGLGRLHSLRL